MLNQTYVLAGVETASIQSYIFASNRLKENVGASYLVAAATGKWALEEILNMDIRSNIAAEDDTITDNDFSSLWTENDIRDGNLDVEILYSGGGNIILLFAEDGFNDRNQPDEGLKPDAISRTFIRRLSRRVQVNAPGLKLVFNVAPFTWDQSLSAAVSDLIVGMKAKRAYQPALSGNGGQAVHIMGASTSLPAVTMSNETLSHSIDAGNPWQPYSAETVAKRNWDTVNAAVDLLQNTINPDSGYRFALELDDLGRNMDDTSYIAIVHADGNGLGILIQGLRDTYDASKNREYIAYMRSFSDKVKDIARRAQKRMVKKLLDSIDENVSPPVIRSQNDRTSDIYLENVYNNQRILPLRPLVSGGDDVTFVCDGRIGLDLAVEFLKAFSELSHETLETSLTACAGVAIVKTHYPFSRAYDLADELAGNAKQMRYLYGDNAPGAIDWHVTAGGLYGSLKTMRRREYEVPDGNLNLRPLFVSSPTDTDLITDDHPAYIRSWEIFQHIMKAFQGTLDRDSRTDNRTSWENHHSRAEKLRIALRRGKSSVIAFKTRYLSGKETPNLPDVAQFEKTGWMKDIDIFQFDDETTYVCGYYDALELIDKYISLQGEATAQ